MFGDIRIIRQGIIHNNGERTSDFKKLNKVELEQGEEIRFSEKQFENLVNSIKMDLKSFIDN